MKNFATKIALCTLSFLAFWSDLPAVPAQVIIIRHGEKDALGNLSQKGLERAGALAPYLVYTPALINFGPPVALYAARPSPDTPPFHHDENTSRCIRTIAPTALLLKLPIHTGFNSLEPEAIASQILNDEYYNGKNVAICWHHESIGTLAIALGIPNPPPYPDNEFDLTWVITYSPTANLVVYHQELLFGDTP